MLRKKVREILLRGVLRMRGYSDSQIDQLYGRIETETGRPILDWLSDGGFEMILEILLKLLAIFAGAPAAEEMAPARAMGDSPNKPMTDAPLPPGVEIGKAAVRNIPPGMLGITVVDGTICVVLPFDLLRPLVS